MSDQADSDTQPLTRRANLIVILVDANKTAHANTFMTTFLSWYSHKAVPDAWLEASWVHGTTQ